MKSVNNKLEYELEESNGLDYPLICLYGIFKERGLEKITDIRCKIEIALRYGNYNEIS